MSKDFTFVLIPTGEGSLQELKKSKAGGLEKDELQIHAKKYFASSDDSKVHTEAMRKAMVDAGKDPMSANPDMMSAISNLGPSIEITCLFIARPTNDFLSVTMYSDSNGEAKKRPVNVRATAIARACGHKHVLIYGDAFVARTFDNEEFPWERRDFFKSEVDLKAKWVVQAAADNAGKNLSSFSSSGQKKNLLKMQTPASTSTAASASSSSTSTKDQGPVKWSQTEDDIEVTIALPKGVRGRDIAVTIKYNMVKFLLKNGHSIDQSKNTKTEGESESEGKVKGGVTLLERLQKGLKLYQKVDPDCSTWSLDDGHLVITLAKREAREWTALYE